MALTPKKEVDSFINVLGSDGSLRMTVTEGTPGAERREWKSADGTKTGVKFEMIYQDVSGFITSVDFLDGDYGKNLIIGITDEDETLKLSLSTNSPFGEDMMKKLPALYLSTRVVIQPYAFVDDKGKTRKGLSIKQNEEKIGNFFNDPVEKKNIHGYPSPEFKKDKKTGENKPFSSDDWKLYFGIARKFLIEYIEENHLMEEAEGKKISKQFDDLTSPKKLDTIEFPDQDINPDDIPF